MANEYEDEAAVRYFLLYSDTGEVTYGYAANAFNDIVKERDMLAGLVVRMAQTMTGTGGEWWLGTAEEADDFIAQARRLGVTEWPFGPDE